MAQARAEFFKDPLPLRHSFRATWVTLFLILLIVWLFPVPDEWRVQKLWLGMAALAFVFLMFRALARYGLHSSSILLLRQIANLLFIALAQFFFPPLGLSLDPLYLLPIVFAGLASGCFASLVIATAATTIILARDQFIFRHNTLEDSSSRFLIGAF